jgi:hypothetical protein
MVSNAPVWVSPAALAGCRVDRVGGGVATRRHSALSPFQLRAPYFRFGWNRAVGVECAVSLLDPRGRCRQQAAQRVQQKSSTTSGRLVDRTSSDSAAFALGHTTALAAEAAAGVAAVVSATVPGEQARVVRRWLSGDSRVEPLAFARSGAPSKRPSRESGSLDPVGNLFRCGRRLFHKAVPSASFNTISVWRRTSLTVGVSRGFCCRRT